MTPDEHTIQELMLEVGDGHSLYVQDWGNKDAEVPVIYLHGGPGDGTSDGTRRWFDPSHHRVIFHDQRGSGKSTPNGSLVKNTTQDLISDINKVADKLNIERFMLVGPSWGSCLALAYALEHPKRVHSMVLRGIFTGSRDEIDWLKKGLYVRFFPDVYDRFLQETPAERLQDPGDYHTERILSDDSSAAKASALTVSNMELALLSLDDRFTPNTDYEDYDITPARIAAHYISNLCFLPDRHILDNAKKLTMPIWIIQGRYDMLCPPSVAWNLHQELPNSQLIWTLAGHANDRSNYDVQRTLLLQLPEK